MNVLPLLHDHRDRRRATSSRPAVVFRAIAGARQLLRLRATTGSRTRADSRATATVACPDVAGVDSPGAARRHPAAFVIPSGSGHQRLQVAIRDRYWDALVPPDAARRR